MTERKVWKILLIDDDPGIRKVMAITLEDAGYEVVTAADGESGLQLCKREAPQIVITDIRMPGMDGIEVLRRIKRTDPDKEVIVATAFSDLELAITALQLDASDFITKPINDNALEVAIKRAQERYTTRKELSDYTTLIEERWMSTAEELAKTFHFQQMLIESSMDGITACDGEGKIVIYNRRMAEMLGYAREEVAGKMALNQFFAPGEAEKFFNTMASEEFGGKDQLFLYETMLIGKTGDKVPAQVSAVTLCEESENLGVVVFFRDLTSIRQLTQQYADQTRMLHQDKMVSLGRLAASVVHEINNPLAGLLNYVRLMLKILGRGPLNEESTQKFQGYLGLMEGELSRCSKIVSNLLAFSRKSKLEFNEVNVNELISKCVMLSDHKLTLQNIRIDTRLPAQPSKVLGDFNQLQQCLINLIFNAIDAMPEEGALTIECSTDHQRGLVAVQIQDTGCGIPKDELLHIFDPFFTTKIEGKGLGLGLSTVYGIIDRHKGTITVASQPGKGAAFTIKLPLSSG